MAAREKKELMKGCTVEEYKKNTNTNVENALLQWSQREWARYVPAKAGNWGSVLDFEFGLYLSKGQT